MSKTRRFINAPKLRGISDICDEGKGREGKERKGKERVGKKK
jgi:hypothetical protein